MGLTRSAVSKAVMELEQLLSARLQRQHGLAQHLDHDSGALVSALGGLDGLVFTAGIGENSAAIRERVCARLEWLGLRFDNDANVAGATRISAPNSVVEVLVIATDEEAMIARHTQTAIEQSEMAARRMNGTMADNA